jgi:hypothetical protein
MQIESQAAVVLLKENPAGQAQSPLASSGAIAGQVQAVPL